MEFQVAKPRGVISKEDAAIWLEVQDHLRNSLERPPYPSDFVDFAEGKEGPHIDRIRALLWFDIKTDKDLAREMRVRRAGDITRAAFVLIKGPDKEPLRVRALLSVKTQQPHGVEHGYMSVMEVARTSDRKKEVLWEAMRDLQAFQQKYRNLAILFGVPGGKVLDAIALAGKQLKEIDGPGAAPRRR
jgi:hypothetical protein